MYLQYIDYSYCYLFVYIVFYYVPVVHKILTYIINFFMT